MRTRPCKVCKISLKSSELLIPFPFAYRKIIVVCSSPDCGWGRYLPDLSEALLNDCCAEFREHCIGSHDLKPYDVEADVRLDLVECTLTLIKQERNGR